MTRPSIPPTEFVPDPKALPAQWGFAMQIFAGGVVTDQLIELEDGTFGGEPIPWVVDGETGVRLCRVVSQWSSLTLAIARAVPLS